jgi:hypothetical protein
MNNPNAIIMVRPANFGFNNETAASNKFQNRSKIEDAQKKALHEFDVMVETLRDAAVDVRVFEDTVTPVKPDAIFPNNWISLHAHGQSVLYPMEAENRRIERRLEVLALTNQCKKEDMLDFTYFEKEGKFLEGTGSIIFDNQTKTAYCAQSSRSDVGVFEQVCQKLGFVPVSFDARDVHGFQIYHTNVLLSIGDNIVVLCAECIENPIERAMVKSALTKLERLFIEISFDQMARFAANCLEVNDKNGHPVLVMSQTAFEAFSAEQLASIRSCVKIVAVKIPTIETLGGGSARCMLLGVG